MEYSIILHHFSNVGQFRPLFNRRRDSPKNLLTYSLLLYLFQWNDEVLEYLAGGEKDTGDSSAFWSCAHTRRKHRKKAQSTSPLSTSDIPSSATSSSLSSSSQSPSPSILSVSRSVRREFLGVIDELLLEEVMVHSAQRQILANDFADFLLKLFQPEIDILKSSALAYGWQVTPDYLSAFPISSSAALRRGGTVVLPPSRQYDSNESSTSPTSPFFCPHFILSNHVWISSAIFQRQLESILYAGTSTKRGHENGSKVIFVFFPLILSLSLSLSRSLSLSLFLSSATCLKLL